MILPHSCLWYQILSLNLLSIRVLLSALRDPPLSTSSLQSSNLYSAYLLKWQKLQQIFGILPAQAKMKRTKGGLLARGVRVMHGNQFPADTQGFKFLKHTF